jgi:hypothetical protein
MLTLALTPKKILPVKAKNDFHLPTILTVFALKISPNGPEMSTVGCKFEAK